MLISRNRVGKKNVPVLPSYDIASLNVTNVSVPGCDNQAIRADVVAHAKNPWPVELAIPSLGFDVLVANCRSGQDLIHLVDASTNPLHVRPRSNVSVSASGIVLSLPKELTRECPDTESSPLDHVLEHYLHGEAMEFFLRGRRLPDTPPWVGDIMSLITVPVALPGRPFDNIVRNFSLIDLDLRLPDPLGDPNDPNDGKTLISGTLEVMVALPREMNFDANVTGVRAAADLLYRSQKLGELHLRQWQAANSTRIVPTNGGTAGFETLLKVESRLRDVPLDITDGDVFAKVASKLLLGIQTVVLDIRASVDGRINTVLGSIVVKGIPTEGSIPVKRPSLFLS